CQQAYSDPLTF
nr:immunoglobulin light chain junction region [Macaca mulatta]MOW41653.1 immunoglobulin light chain junction region [Macaca mulatta]MOW43342.1 immunoglobulin light chain junction region [Macaca mulatta]MOW43956.1 immunoglobulin light chain junction region [Macaca mulatta]MOW44854.1 immunoglobulin light chain junction region [Macaca mulatta]